jgi:rRNA maturation protein Nop10
MNQPARIPWPLIDMCKKCGDDTNLTSPSAQRGDPDFGEYECSNCGNAQKMSEPDLRKWRERWMGGGG